MKVILEVHNEKELETAVGEAFAHWYANHQHQTYKTKYDQYDSIKASVLFYLKKHIKIAMEPSGVVIPPEEEFKAIVQEALGQSSPAEGWSALRTTLLSNPRRGRTKKGTEQGAVVKLERSIHSIKAAAVNKVKKHLTCEVGELWGETTIPQERLLWIEQDILRMEVEIAKAKAKCQKRIEDSKRDSKEDLL